MENSTGGIVSTRGNYMFAYGGISGDKPVVGKWYRDRSPFDQRRPLYAQQPNRCPTLYEKLMVTEGLIAETGGGRIVVEKPVIHVQPNRVSTYHIRDKSWTNGVGPGKQRLAAIRPPTDIPNSR
jgi:hypothetical protein